ncbi:DNA primase [Thermithiobacillus plumbiphilus]|uniref:DNA primase n=1 Tax=Thermithiobacillus plumbiphilus TaxID=1729899 RepID=A0ABU9D8R3_9PROT
MARIPQAFIDELLARCDLVSLIDARVPLKKAGRDHVARCPFHQEKTPSFHVSPDKQIYYCFGCHAHGNAIGFLMEYERLSFPEAVRDLAQMTGMRMPEESDGPKPAAENHPLLIQQLEAVARRYQEHLRKHPPALAYLQQRGLNEETIRQFELGFAPARWDFLVREFGQKPQERDMLLGNGLIIPREGKEGYYDRFRDRIMFPIRDHRGRLIGFGGRVLTADAQPKYLNSPETQLYHKSDVLYGFFQARDAIRAEQKALVVEGYMDVIALHQQDIRFAVATSGTATTHSHLERLFRAAPEIVFCFDGDRAGREAAWRALDNALPALQEGRLLRFLFLPEGEDPDSYVRKAGRESFLTQLEQAIPALDFLLARLGEQVDMSRTDERARLASLAKPYLDKVPPGPLKQLYDQRLRELVGLAPIQKEFRPRAKAQRQSRAKPTRLSLVARSMALLLQLPEQSAWQAINRPRLAEVRAPGIGLLCQMLDIVLETPHMNTAILLSRFSEHPSLSRLAALASLDLGALSGPEDGKAEVLAADVAGCVDALNELSRQARFEVLKARANDSEHPLNADELKEFVTLLQRSRPSRSGQES